MLAADSEFRNARCARHFTKALQQKPAICSDDLMSNSERTHLDFAAALTDLSRHTDASDLTKSHEEYALATVYWVTTYRAPIPSVKWKEM